MFEEYNHIIVEQSSLRIISDVDPHKPVEISHVIFFTASSSYTRRQIVYDASVKSTSPVLNDCLPAGPSLLSDIPDVLMRFRYHRVALAADIVKAFLVVRIKEADQDVLRFLWIDDPDNEHPNIVVKHFNRVVFGVTSSPFLLNTTIRHHATPPKRQDQE